MNWSRHLVAKRSRRGMSCERVGAKRSSFCADEGQGCLSLVATARRPPTLAATSENTARKQAQAWALLAFIARWRSPTFSQSHLGMAGQVGGTHHLTVGPMRTDMPSNHIGCAPLRRHRCLTISSPASSFAWTHGVCPMVTSLAPLKCRRSLATDGAGMPCGVSAVRRPPQSRRPSTTAYHFASTVLSDLSRSRAASWLISSRLGYEPTTPQADQVARYAGTGRPH